MFLYEKKLNEYCVEFFDDFLAVSRPGGRRRCAPHNVSSDAPPAWWCAGECVSRACVLRNVDVPPHHRPPAHPTALP